MIAFYILIFLIIATPVGVIWWWFWKRTTKSKSSGTLSKRFDELDNKFNVDLSALKQDAKNKERQIHKDETDVKTFKKKVSDEKPDETDWETFNK